MATPELRALFFLLACLSTTLHAQVSLQADGRGHYNIHSYNGFQTTEERGHKIQIALSGQHRTVSGWSLKARFNSPLISSTPNLSGSPFPPEKVKIRFTQEEINGSPPVPWPTLAAAGATLAPLSMTTPGAETPLISGSPVALQTGSSYYVSVVYYFAIDIEGGAYLGGMLSDNGGNAWNSSPALYQTTIMFSLYDSNQSEVASYTVPCNIQVHRPLADAPEAAPAYGLEITGAARGATLDLHNVSSYLHGVSARYPNALKIKSETPCDVTVRSLSDDLSSESGDKLPVSVIQLQLLTDNASPFQGSLYAVSLSAEPQTILRSGNGQSENHYLTIQYSTAGNDSRLLHAPTGSYSSTLIYQLIPR